MFKFLTISFMCVMLVGCSTTATQFKRIDGKLVEVERLRLQGLGNRDAKFSDKAEISCDSGLRIPNIELDIDKITD